MVTFARIATHIRHHGDKVWAQDLATLHNSACWLIILVGQGLKISGIEGNWLHYLLKLCLSSILQVEPNGLGGLQSVLAQAMNSQLVPDGPPPPHGPYFCKS